MSSKSKIDIVEIPTWSQVRDLDDSAPQKLSNIFTQSGIYTPQDFQSAKRLLEQALLSQFSANDIRTKGHAQEVTNNFMLFIRTLFNNIANNPSILGNISGISLNDANVLSSGIAEMLLAISEPARNFVKSSIGWEILSLATVTWASVTASKYPSGKISIPILSIAPSYKCQYYPGACIEILSRIQREYDKLQLPNVPKMRAILGSNNLGGTDRLNSCIGDFQAIIPIFVNNRLELPELDYRRDNRQLYDKNGNKKRIDKEVIPASVQAAREAFFSAYQMSLALGDIEQSTQNLKTNAPKNTIHTIKRDSNFGQLIRLAIETKLFYNAAGIKDIAAYRAANPDTSGVYVDDPCWKSLRVDINNYVFTTASVILECENRLRISDMNNSECCVDPKIGRAPERPDTKKTKMPNFTYFMKMPKEIVEALSVAKSSENFEKFIERTNLHQDTIRRFKDIYIKLCGNDYRNFIGYLDGVSHNIVKICNNISLIHLTRAMSNAVSKGAVSAARIQKPFY